MKSSTHCTGLLWITLALLDAPQKSSAFLPQKRTLVSSPLFSLRAYSRINHLLRASNDDQNEESSSSSSAANAAFDKLLADGKLRDAVRSLKTQPDEIDINKQRWDNIFYAIEERTANAEENTENLRMAAEFPTQSAARQEMTDMYRTLQQNQQLALFGAVNTKNPIAGGSYSIPPPLLETILNLPMKALTPEPTSSLLLAGVTVALVEGALSYGSGISFDFLVISSLAAAFFDRLFLNGAVFESFLKLFSPGVQDKILRHEAGHFLIAYLLGCPVEGIVLSAWAALKDRRFGNRQVSAGTSFFDPELSQQINSNGLVTRSSIDRYSMIVMAGIAAEADFYGRADGGAGDEMALVAFLSQLNAGGKGAQTTWNDENIRNQARWGALQAVLMLREYKPAYDALVDALERGSNLGDCIHAIERAARKHDLKPLEKPVGYIVEESNGVIKWSKDNPVVEEQNLSTLVETREFDEEKSIADLQEYRAVVEEKLRNVEEKLKKLQD